MTGYGKAEAALLSGSKLVVEIRTLNGKLADVNIKSSILPKDKELIVRQMISTALQRGTIDVFLTLEKSADKSSHLIDKEVLKDYMVQLSEAASDAGLAGSEVERMIFESALRLPDVVDYKKAEAIVEEDWPAIEKAFEDTLAAVNDFRLREGAVLEKDVLSRIDNILALYDRVEAFEPERIEAVRERLGKNLSELAQKVDPQRFEQEMIFYLEKLDINEEKVRLRQHCKYFRETLFAEPNPGKKLGFIIQEIGREINTTGSKANHAGIQQCVVKMKDDLEKMREQSMNIL